MSEIKYYKTFFNYDEIDHYKIEIDDADDLYFDQNISSIDQLKYKVIYQNTPENIDDLDFLNFLNEIGYLKQKINSTDFNNIDNIFIEKPEEEMMTAGCIAIFRDILVFKKNNEVTGVAKICFSCHKYQIVGTETNTDNFGSNNDYSQLADILYNT
ncbi:hypothetical protein NZ698_00770 [Chryseobacterium sp. PBS4-4]|uniref:Uncharacterized protein n=1 Tax=Chryseobacterium edaphi TaxID=2976532 RepID=A0ABT2W0E4_9FLAO|nr:hypothetical protein [Chryseobacterium edaphi]MCU7615714.1 hypothetical protein [Chryseobacterium edaphi]